MIYHRLRLEVYRDPFGGYFVRTTSPRGEGRSAFSLPSFALDSAVFEAMLLGSTTATLPNSVQASGFAPTAAALGEQLFEALFQGEALRLFERNLEYLERDTESALRIELVFDTNDHDLVALQALPWELIRQRGSPDYIALDRRRSVIRFITVARPVAAFSRPKTIRILAIAADPLLRGARPLNLEGELRKLRAAVNSVSNAELVELHTSTLDSLREALVRAPFHVLHFMGHGGSIAGRDEHVLYFEGPHRRADEVSGTDLMNKLSGIPSLRLVVLNACESGSVQGSPEKATANSFVNVASALILGGLPAVVAMQTRVTDTAAIEFSRAFYQRLTAGDTVDGAVIEGRQAMHSAQGHGFEWAVPVLFERSETGELFLDDSSRNGPRTGLDAGRRRFEWSIPALFLRSLDDRSILTAERREKTKAPLPPWVGRLAAWRPFGLPVGARALQIGGALGSLVAGIWCSLVVQVAAGRATSQPFGLFLLLTLLSGALATCAVWSARQWPTLRAFWISLAVLGMILLFLL